MWLNFVLEFRVVGFTGFWGLNDGVFRGVFWGLRSWVVVSGLSFQYVALRYRSPCKYTSVSSGKKRIRAHISLTKPRISLNPKSPKPLDLSPQKKTPEAV